MQKRKDGLTSHQIRFG